MAMDLAGDLRNGKIPNYFKKESNLLDGKDPDMLERLANKLEERAAEF